MKKAMLDLDGVIVDFVKGVCRLYHVDNPYIKPGGPRGDGAWDLLELLKIAEPKSFWNFLGFDFWANLEKTPEADRIVQTVLRTVGNENVCFLTSPCSAMGCSDGKRAWVHKHYPQIPILLSVCSEENPQPPKEFLANGETILIDDCAWNVDTFSGAGGWTYLYPRPWNRRHAAEHAGLCYLERELHEFVVGLD